MRGRHRVVSDVCVGEMRHQYWHSCDGRTRTQGGISRRKVVQGKAQPMHSGVEFDPNPKAMGTLPSLQQGQLRRGMHHNLEAVARCCRQLISVEHAFEQQHGMRETRLAQLNTFLQTGHREGIGIGQCLGSHHAAMPIRIRLHHRQHACLWGLPAYHGEVVAQRSGLDHRANERRHQ